MEIKETVDAHGRKVKFEVNMGNDLTIHLEDHFTDNLFEKSIHFDLLAARNSLEFCEWCFTQASQTDRKDRITSRSITICYDGVGFGSHEDENVMSVTTRLDNGKFVTIKNQFPDADGRMFRSKVCSLLLDTLREAVAYGEQCAREHKALMEQARGARQ